MLSVSCKIFTICICNNTHTHTKKTKIEKHVPSRQNGKFYFQTEIEPHQPILLPEILWKCASFLAWNVFHAMFRFTFFLCNLFSFLGFSLNFGVQKKIPREKCRKEYKCVQTIFPSNVDFHRIPSWRMHAHSARGERERENENIFKKIKLWVWFFRVCVCVFFCLFAHSLANT